MTAVTTVLLDLDRTLCEYRHSGEELLAAAFERAGVEQFCAREDVGAVADEVPTAESDVEFYTLCLAAAAERCGRAVAREDCAAVARAYEGAVDHANVRYRPGAETTLAALRDEYALGLVTNGARATQERKLDALVFATPERGVKPDPYPFERALDALDAAPAEAVHVGDSLHADVAGANAMGLRSAWVSHGESNAGGSGGASDGPTPTHTLDSLADLRAAALKS
ncbi:HAD family hydrolase [Halobacteriales archaeon QS_4_69_34]|nr:MAG: HAD family hydrolase [Halobacteriales archaeon QS_4_69_34]